MFSVALGRRFVTLLFSVSDTPPPPTPLPSPHTHTGSEVRGAASLPPLRPPPFVLVVLLGIPLLRASPVLYVCVWGCASIPRYVVVCVCVCVC